ncbi:tetratricopeptide repeat protein [Archangium primigenium]|uniref:tetratricopeptide repeat protein n=1 Tax=[Archangium] primigenium TaxID=2792470 RepID=UPI001958EC0C|nr:tetratricopeptide repeat protein [Archangium primigenium]MBM7114756.1 tetratricopeptide repeat protein [Archangium primigenium]
MAASNANSGGPRDWRKRESPLSALAQVGLVALVLAGVVAWVVHRGGVRREVDTRLKAARALAQQDNPADLQRALGELDALLQLDANAKEALALAADVNARLWLEHQRAEAQAPARANLARAQALDARSGERYATHAWVLLADGKAPAAATFLAELQRQGAKSPKLSLVEARLLQATGRLTEARQAFARAHEVAWREPRYAVARGEALLDEGLYVQALEVLKKAASAHPEHLRARLSLALARLYLDQGRDEAARTVEAALGQPEALTPALTARLHTVRAALALAEGQTDAARAAADQALAASPEELHALLLRAQALARGKDTETRAAFEAAVARRRTAPLPYLEGARRLQELGDGEGALALLDAYEATFRDVRVTSAAGKTSGALERDDRYWLARGHVLEALTHPEEALVAYDRALAVQGLHQARAQYAKATLLLARGDAPGAQPLLSELAPENGQGTMPEAYEALGRLFFLQGDFSQGCQRHYLGLSRARQQGVPLEALRRQAQDVERRLTEARQAAMARTWHTEAETLLR